MYPSHASHRNGSTRPIPSGTQAVSFSAAVRAPSALAVTYMLRNIHPANLHARLLEAVDGSTTLHPAWAIDNLASALKAIGLVTIVTETASTEQRERHCVRCHESYFERDNGLSACIIPHDKGDVPGQDRRYYACCMANMPTTEKLATEFCIVGRHTTLVDNVVYNMTNVQDCATAKCFFEEEESSEDEDQFEEDFPSTQPAN